MNDTLLQMTLLMISGAGWRLVCPGGLGAGQTRLVLTTVVYYFLLPAMVLDVMWSTPVGLETLQYSTLGCASILFGIGLAWLTARLCGFAKPQTGALILAAAYANVTYLGLPVLEQTFGAWARSVAIQIDLFAAAPLVFTVGIALARHYGKDDGQSRSSWSFLNAPPFWAAFAAMALNVNRIVAPHWFVGLLHTLSGAVAPLMIFSLGLALDWRAIKLSNLPYIVPVVAIKLALVPLAAWSLATFTSFDRAHLAAAVLDLAMPSMVLGVVLCDRYRLDSALYAMAVTVTTALSLLTLPFWHGLLL